MHDPRLVDLQAFAMQLAAAARPIAQSWFRTPMEVTIKADTSPVTRADREIESCLRDLINRHHPDHGMLGEETGGDLSRRFTWVIDPIDGTKSFICGVPLFGTLIALLDNGRPCLGLIDMPMLDERWVGGDGIATFNGKAARTSGCRALHRARLFATLSDRITGPTAQAISGLAQRVALRRPGADCYAYGLLASGHCDLVVEVGLQLYDVMALVPVIEGAGGVITDWQGAPLAAGFDGCVLAAATPALHAQALTLLDPHAVAGS